MKTKILARLSDVKSMPRSKVPLVELTGRNRVLIENHNGVLEYSLEEILIKVSYGTLSVKGQKLQLLQLNADQLVISGLIEMLCPIGGSCEEIATH